MAIIRSASITVPKFASNGSVSAVAVGGALMIIGAVGWIENKGPCTIYLVSMADTSAKADPVNNGVTILPGGRVPLGAGVALADYGLLADGDDARAFVLAS